MGVNMNLAPVVDVNTNPLNPVIGVRVVRRRRRAWSPDFGVQTIQALQASGVSAVAQTLPRPRRHRRRLAPRPAGRAARARPLQSLELLPFEAAHPTVSTGS